MTEATLFADGLTWPEAPRWRDGALWISDTRSLRLMRVRRGAVEVVCDVPGRPSGMGFLPDGRLLLATALDRKLLYVSASGQTELAADLGSLASAYLNDMVVDHTGRAWVGDTGFRFGTDDPRVPGRVIVFDAEAGARVAVEDVMFPNGAVIAEDGRTFYLCETFADRVTRFEIQPDGSLGHRREHAALGAAPDGLCLDEEGALWVPLLFEGIFRRLRPDGTVDRSVAFPGHNAIACMIGGEDNRTLFLCVSKAEQHGQETLHRGAVYTLPVTQRGAGLPR